ncbi:MAG TPA: fumarylacetoacetate hydrolase family protein [Usitatibacteraceae bacterium]|nr:fumarylacetoacetate hydrolase family protein [Usitatibacteraceae bacterium]
MKLVTFSLTAGSPPRPGLVVDPNRIVDIPAHVAATAGVDFSTMLGIIRGGAAARKALDALAARPPATAVAMADVRLHAPIPRPAKNVFCVGWNYLEHFEEGAKKLQDNRELPQWPVFFSKAPTAVIGPTDPVPFDPAISTSLDWEVELGVVIGPGGKNIKAEDAMQHVWGYTVINDVSWRDLQRRHGGQWHKGKSLDGTCPMGPVLVTADSLDHANLRVTCRVNGVTKQDSNTKFLYFKLPRLINDLSMGMTLEAGDIISTGTPEGVGFARTPPEFLKPGDLLETEIEGIGTLRNPIGG